MSGTPIDFQSFSHAIPALTAKSQLFSELGSQYSLKNREKNSILQFSITLHTGGVYNKGGWLV